jgi:hypothetical protein
MKKFKIKPRTVRQFVEEVVTEGRTLAQIKCIALNTRWKTQVDSVMLTATKLKNFLGT